MIQDTLGMETLAAAAGAPLKALDEAGNDDNLYHMCGRRAAPRQVREVILLPCTALGGEQREEFKSSFLTPSGRTTPS